MYYSGEVIEWTVLSYIRDGISLGKNLACINPGHFNWEELGARYAKDWLMELTENKVSVFYVPTGDMWKYQTKRVCLNRNRSKQQLSDVCKLRSTTNEMDKQF